MKEITFTVTRSTRNFGGLFDITTKNPNGKDHEFHDVGVMQLWDVMDEITEDLNNEGFAVLFEIEG